jgi:hypothetical protein
MTDFPTTANHSVADTPISTASEKDLIEFYGAQRDKHLAQLMEINGKATFACFVFAGSMQTH